jgi:hypothetical protein
MTMDWIRLAVVLLVLSGVTMIALAVVIGQ